MPEHESQPEERDGEEREVGSAAPEDEAKVVGEGADVPPGEGEEAEEAGVEGSGGSGGRTGPRDELDADDQERDGRDADDRDELAREIESDPASNPDDPKLREIKGG